jgi:drug/metabolite transporter (DMT)-like permease
MSKDRHGYLFGFALLMAFDTLAQVSFKLAGMHAFPPQFSVDWLMRLMLAPWIYGAVVGYLGAFFTWMRLLERAPIGPAFAASHLEVVSVMLLSAMLFDEQIGVVKTLGALLIVGGIVCIGLGERDVHLRDA